MSDTTEQYGEAQIPGRVEDMRLLTGRGCFTADRTLPGQAHAVFLRSPHGHANVRGVDIAAAKAMPGVLAVFTAADLTDLSPIPCNRPMTGRDGRGSVLPSRPILVADCVRHVGEAVAMVVAETEARAVDATEAISVAYDPLPAIAEPEAALDPGAPQIWDDAPGNLCLDWEAGDKNATDAAFARAAHVVRRRFANTRLVVNAMEPRAALAEYDPETGRYTLYSGSQGVRVMRKLLAESVLGIVPDKLRVISGDVGGGFGMKTQSYAEYPALLFAARALGRPVKWVATRSESFLTDNQARDGVLEGALALDADGRFLGLRVTSTANIGAYPGGSGTGIQTRNMAMCLAGVYRTPAIHVTVRCAFTNTAPVGPYRGAGRPEANYLLERLVDEAAVKTGIDRIALRRRNMLDPADMPYATPVGPTYDSGEFEAILDRTLALADWDGFAARRTASEQADRLRGLGIATFLEHAGGQLAESIRLGFSESRGVTVFSAAQSQGQGHATSFAQIVAERLGVPFDAVSIVEGDSDRVPDGGSTTASRSTVVCGGAMATACDLAIETGRQIAAHLLEAAVQDVVYEHGAFAVAGTDRRIALLDLPRRTARAASWPDDVPRSLDTEFDHTAEAHSFPNGCHICEVEIDPASGRVTVERYAGVDDVGRVINDPIVHGQIHGGVAQGAGQVITEHCVYDDQGQLTTGSLMDYALPRADLLPAMRFDFHPVPCRTNPLGVKGAGESGTIGALPALANAVADALRSAGVGHFDMPATPHVIWRALQSAKS